jgi:hypothetical protein
MLAPPLRAMNGLMRCSKTAIKSATQMNTSHSRIEIYGISGGVIRL